VEGGAVPPGREIKRKDIQREDGSGNFEKDDPH